MKTRKQVVFHFFLSVSVACSRTYRDSLKHSYEGAESLDENTGTGSLQCSQLAQYINHFTHSSLAIVFLGRWKEQHRWRTQHSLGEFSLKTFPKCAWSPVFPSIRTRGSEQTHLGRSPETRLIEHRWLMSNELLTSRSCVRNRWHCESAHASVCLSSYSAQMLFSLNFMASIKKKKKKKSSNKQDHFQCPC